MNKDNNVIGAFVSLILTTVVIALIAPFWINWLVQISEWSWGLVPNL